MKKFTLLFILLSQICIAQSQIIEGSAEIESCGLNEKSDLNKCEVDYFNTALVKQRGDFNFEGKKVAFAYDKYGSGIISKKDYFDRWEKSYHSKGERVSNQILILTDREKEESGGFDVVIISWNKMGPLSSKKRGKLIIRIRKNNSV